MKISVKLNRPDFIECRGFKLYHSHNIIFWLVLEKFPTILVIRIFRTQYIISLYHRLPRSIDCYASLVSYYLLLLLFLKSNNVIFCYLGLIYMLFFSCYLIHIVYFEVNRVSGYFK